MISYDLAKKLKDAGFPQGMKAGDILLFENKEWVHTGGGHLEAGGRYEGFYVERAGLCCVEQGIYDSKSIVRNIYNDLGVKIPSLAELIKACGDYFEAINRYSACKYHRDTTTFTNTCFGGNSPEEAVANLYLHLFSKPKNSMELTNFPPLTDDSN